jgi:hypothetical protein
VEGIAITSISTDASCEGASEVINAAFAYAHNCKLGCVLEAAGRTWEGIIGSELSRTPGVRRHRGGFGTFDGLEPSQQVDFVYFTKYTVARKTIRFDSSGRVAGLGRWNVGKNPRLGAAVGHFGEPDVRYEDNGCRVAWELHALRMLFANFGGHPACHGRYGYAQTLVIRGVNSRR